MGSAGRDEIIAFCAELLDVAGFDDYGPNGLQVPGVEEVGTVISGVSANRELIERAVEGGAELLIAHHGLLWEFHPRAISEQLAARLRPAFAAGLNVAGYHLPLDAHPEIGNNALLCRGLGLRASGRFAPARGREIGVVGEYATPIAADELTARVTGLLDREPLLLGAGPDEVRRVGIVSGAGASFVAEAPRLGLDALITGEPAEHATADAREAGIHFYAAGHHATETLGIRRLGGRIAERFDVEHSFVEIPNPV